MQQLAQQRNGYCQQTPKTGIAEADLPVKVELHVGIIPYGTAEPNVDNPPEQKFDCRGNKLYGNITYSARYESCN